MQFDVPLDVMPALEEAARRRGMNNLQFVTWAIAQAIKTPPESRTLATIDLPQIPDTLTQLLVSHLASRIRRNAQA